MKRLIKSLILVCLVVTMTAGCQSLLKLTYKNEDFEWVTKENLGKVVIQSTRDKGFRFVVTDEATLKELYESLSSAMAVEEKNPLAPDYIFEFNTFENQVIKFYYTTGSGSAETRGNFYNDEKSFLVLNRIDNNIIKNLFALRKPRDFFKGYYGSLLEAVKQVQADYKVTAVGVMVNEDKEMLKFQMSYELLDFNLALNALGAIPITEDKETELVMNIKTRGYTTDLYKAVVEVKNNKDRKTKSYYIKSDYVGEKWTTIVTTERPDGF